MDSGQDFPEQTNPLNEHFILLQVVILTNRIQPLYMLYINIESTLI